MMFKGSYISNHNVTANGDRRLNYNCYHNVTVPKVKQNSSIGGFPLNTLQDKSNTKFRLT